MFPPVPTRAVRPSEPPTFTLRGVGERGGDEGEKLEKRRALMKDRAQFLAGSNVIRSDDDVGVRMAGVVMVDRDPVEAGGEIQFHLAHEVAGEAAKVSHLGCILGCDNEPELVAISPAALHECLAVGLVLESGIGPAPFIASRKTAPTSKELLRKDSAPRLRRD
jgi:hypothetical protein